MQRWAETNKRVNQTQNMVKQILHKPMVSSVSEK